MTQSHKACPSCSVPAPIYASACDNCGHVFRTQFMPPLDKTQILPELPDTHFPSGRARRKSKTLPPAFLTGIIGVTLIAALLITVSLAYTNAKHRGIHANGVAGASGSLTGDPRGAGEDTKNTPGHLVQVADAEALVPLCSQRQVLETLGAPLQNVGDVWSYPADKGAAVGVKFAGVEGAKYVQGIVIVDGKGSLVWAKTPHLWKSMPMTTFKAGKYGLPLRPLKRYLEYFTQ